MLTDNCKILCLNLFFKLTVIYVPKANFYGTILGKLDQIIHRQNSTDSKIGLMKFELNNKIDSLTAEFEERITERVEETTQRCNDAIVAVTNKVQVSQLRDRRMAFERQTQLFVKSVQKLNQAKKALNSITGRDVNIKWHIIIGKKITKAKNSNSEEENKLSNIIIDVN